MTSVPAVAAQVSLYPLRQEHLGPAIDQAVAAFRAHGLQVWEGMMSTVLAGDLDTVVAALRDAFAAAAAQGEVVLVVTLSNGCPVPSPAPASSAARGQPAGGGRRSEAGVAGDACSGDE